MRLLAILALAGCLPSTSEPTDTDADSGSTSEGNLLDTLPVEMRALECRSHVRQ
jgi:hypothetical protein